MPRYLPHLIAILPLLLAGASPAQIPTAAPGLEVISRTAAGTPTALALDGRIAYLGHGARLEAVSVEQPATPLRLSFLDLSAEVVDLVVRDGYVFVTTGDGAFNVIDASDPRRLRVAARLEANGKTGYYRLAPVGNFVFCTGWAQALTVIDVTHPDAPCVVATMSLPSPALDVAVEEDRLYVATATGLQVFDITDPRAPVFLAGFDSGMDWIYRIEVREDVAYCSYNAGIMVLDLRDPAHPVENSWMPEDGFTAGLAFCGADLFAAGDHVARYRGHDPTPIWLDSELGPAVAVAVDGDLLVAACRWAGLVTYELDGEAEPRRLAMLEAGVPIDGIAIDGTRAWVTCEQSGVRLFDLSDPAHPRQIGSLTTIFGPLETRMWTRGVCPRGERAVVFGIGDTGLRVVEDVGDGNLRTIFRAPPPVDDAVPSYFAAVATSDGWIVWGEPGVFGLRLDAAGAVTMERIAWPAGIRTAASAGEGLLYAFNDRGFLCLLTATAAGDVELLGTLSLSDPFYHPTAAGAGLLWVGQAFVGVQVVDISDPAAPRLRGWVDLPGDLRFESLHGEMTAIAASGSSAFFMARYRALAVVETPDPDAPSMRRIWAERSGPVAVAAFADASGSMACVADWNGRLTIVRPPFAVDVAGVPASAAAVALTLAPNPCNPRTTIAFTLAEAGPASVNVFDVRGRLVRRLHQGGLESGPHNLPWSGDDERGRPVAAGVYVVRVEGAGWAQSTRVTLVR
ncbi:MAG: T9SS type A sorting domain-containing protein [bacterium]|nr:T9SS type A sorting domain-containing protein [bacterium]